MFSKLKEKDDSFKKKVAIFFAGFVSMGLLVVWIQYKLPNTTTKVVETKEKGSTFFNQFSEQVSNAFVGITGLTTEVKNLTLDIITNVGTLKETETSDTITSASTTDILHTSLDQ